MAAIYQWLGRTYQLLTTTLYPIEAVESLSFDGDITYGSMSPVQSEAYATDGDVISATLIQLLLEYGPDTEEYATDGDVISATLIQLLLEYGPDAEAYRTDGDVISATLELKLVEVDTPDEELQFDGDIKPSGCSMTPI